MIFRAGEQGFLYLDLLAALIILSFTAAVLLSSVRSLLNTSSQEKICHEINRKAYYSTLLEQIQE